MTKEREPNELELEKHLGCSTSAEAVRLVEDAHRQGIITINEFVDLHRHFGGLSGKKCGLREMTSADQVTAVGQSIKATLARLKQHQLERKPSRPKRRR